MDTSERGNILVVDDTLDNLRLLTGILTKQGYTVRPVPDGALAMASVQTALPDLILLDIMMPGLSGYDVCQRLKADERTREIPIIFISALNETFDKVKAFTLGGVDYITKPFQVEEVAARVQTHLMLRNLHKELQTKNVQLQDEIHERIEAEHALKHSLLQIERAKQEWESTADSLSYLVCLLDEQGRILRSNRTIEHWGLGDVSQVRGQRFHDVLHPNCADPDCYLATFLAHAWSGITQGQSAEHEIRDPILKRYLQLQIRPIAEHENHPSLPVESFAVGCLHDISKRKQAEEIMRQRNCELAVLNQMNNLLQECRAETETYQVLVSGFKELFPDDSGCLYLMAEDRALLHAVATWGPHPIPTEPFSRNDCWCLLNGNSLLIASPGELPLCPHFATTPDYGYLCVPLETSPQRSGVLHVWLQPREPGYSDQEYRHHLELKRMMVMRLAEHYALSLANLQLRDSLRSESIRDPLTGLFNRRYMEESLQREAYRAQRNRTSIALLMMDIDHFKRLNDTYGHTAGDVVLVELAAFLQSSIRGGDIICRYGGEEFLLILPDTTREDAEIRAHDLIEQIRKLTIPYQQMTFQITVSMGLAVVSDFSVELPALIQPADHALYHAKQQGRNRIVVANS